MRLTTDELEPYLDLIRALPFIQDVEVLHTEVGDERWKFDALICLHTPRQQHEFLVEVVRTNLTRPLVNGLLARTADLADRPWILLAPYVGRPIGEYLAERRVNYVDAVGNCHLRIADEHIALVQGKTRQRTRGAGRGTGVAGYKALFTILARPELLNAPVRVLAQVANIGKTAAAAMVERLIEEGLVGVGVKQRQILDRQTLTDRWLTGYATVVRPRLFIGNFQTPDDTPATLEDRIQETLGTDVAWVWGGGAAAMRLTGFYRGETTTLHVEKWTDAHTKRLRGLPAPNGPLVVLLAPGNLAFDGVVPHTAHPLLVYTELLTVGKARAREAAAELQTRYLQAEDDAAH